MQIIKSAVAAENQNNENVGGAGDDLLPKNNIGIEVTPAEIDFDKKQAGKEAIAKKIAQQRAAAEIALINNSPILAGPTTKLPDGKRTCPLKHPQPSGRGGKPHIDEDCCADYDEYPNPRCDYSPAQMAALKKH